MKRAIIASAAGVLFLGTLLVLASTMGCGTKGTEVWWQEGSGPLIKATLRTTRSGIIYESRSEPENLKLIFKPADRFHESNEGGYSLWTFNSALYTIDAGSPAKLSDFFAEGAQYWLQITGPNGQFVLPGHHDQQ
jgi:hypothetical protein